MCGKSELQTTLDKIKNASIHLYGNRLNKIILFGSYARGDYTDESDIDLMIVLNCGPDDIKKLRKQTVEMTSDISLEQEVVLSVLLRDKKHFEDNLDFLPFYKNILKEGVMVYG